MLLDGKPLNIKACQQCRGIVSLRCAGHSTGVSHISWGIVSVNVCRNVRVVDAKIDWITSGEAAGCGVVVAGTQVLIAGDCGIVELACVTERVGRKRSRVRTRGHGRCSVGRICILRFYCTILISQIGDRAEAIVGKQQGARCCLNGLRSAKRIVVVVAEVAGGSGSVGELRQRVVDVPDQALSAAAGGDGGAVALVVQGKGGGGAAGGDTGQV